MTTGSVDKLFARYVRTADAAALAEVFDRSSAEILRVARHFARDDTEAEDLLQDAFLSAIERAETFRPGERVVPWLLGILVNAARARFRRKRDVAALDGEAVASDDPAQSAHDREVHAQILAALTGIPQPYRDVLERHLEHGQNGKQISRELGRPANTVRSQLRRGLKLLRAALPAGFAAACQPSPTRGLAAVRDVVITRATANTAAVSTNVSWFGVWWMSKKLVFVGAAALMLAAAWWVVDPMGSRSAAADGGVEVERATVGGVEDRDLARAESFVPAKRTPIEPADTAPAPDVRYVQALAGFHGRIVDAERQPVVGAVVDLYRVDPSTMVAGTGSQPQFVIATTESDRAGEFVLTGVPTRAMFSLRAAHDRGDSLRIVEHSPGPGEQVELGDFELTPPTGLHGRVVGPDDEPIEGAVVRSIDMPPLALAMFGVAHLDPERDKIVLREDGDRVVDLPEWTRELLLEFGFCTAVSDAEGRFELRGVQPGSNALLARAAGFAVEVRPSTRAHAGEDTDVGTLRLREGELAAVRVIDQDGRPVAGAEVLIAPAGRSLPIEFASPAPDPDLEGRTSLAGMPAGNVTVAVRRSIAHRWIITEPSSAARDLTVRLPATRTLVVRMQDASSGQPIEGAEVRIAGDGGSDLGVFEVAWLPLGPLAADTSGHQRLPRSDVPRRTRLDGSR